MDEQLLIDGCKRGEASARKELYELYAPAMMSVCARYVRDRETARDLLQDGFIKVFTKIQTYSATGPFGAWIRRVFVTTALEYLRKYDALRSSASIDEFRLMNMENRLKMRMLPYWIVCRPTIYWNASPGCPMVTGPSSTCMLSKDIRIRK